MSIIGNVGKTIGGVGKLLIPPRKQKKVEPKDFIRESSDEYADRLRHRKNRGY